ncbi:hypothetical protein OCK74_25265 [Chitinophagaceae bacterium LB-8]|uniref:LVIVD repeat-containing protein n=1 Tax=Paraflavisolibacter caeni TaxID=2982496 RepID=A0A9X2XZH1_9BACT|nr:hypothetical protein [Paraflavisolibacter caeni]MCU7552454.1 hypothetical protein [Paraflavisolibacter caeni]
MRKRFSFAVYFSFSFLTLLIFSGCLKDQCSNTYTIYSPVYKTLTQVRADMKSGQPQAIERPGKIYIRGNFIFWNELNKGIHIIDNSNPASPKNISFIKVPGNVDIAVKGSYLYADNYSDLVVFDISKPTNVFPVKFLNKVFTDRGGYYWSTSTNPDSIMVIVDYKQKDTVVDCSTASNWYGRAAIDAFNTASGAQFYVKNPTGVGGSMARFAIASDHLYSVSYSQLSAFNINIPYDPQLANIKQIGWNIETIFPFQDKLFIGSSNGMFIYNINDAANPALVSQFSHVRSCDPVIADENYAYVTLRSGTACQGFTNQLEVLDISQITQPSLLKTYAMTNPHGLAKDDQLLFICDGKDGLKVYDASDVNNLKIIKTISGLETYDVIALNNLAIVVANDGLYQFDYSDRNNIKQISRITIQH